MLQKILVAVDQSEGRRTVFDQAIFLAKAVHAEVKLVHILSQEEEASPSFYGVAMLDYYPGLQDVLVQQYQEEWQRFEEEGLALLQALKSEAQTDGIEVSFQQYIGSPGQAICKIATEWGADLIVMGHRGRSGLSEMVLGSVSNYVLHHAPCALLTLPTPVQEVV